MEVRVSGAVMAPLFLELANGQGDVEGILLGDSTGRTFNTISDSQTEQLRFERIATIQGMLPCSKVFSFYDGIGKIEKEKLKTVLRDGTKDIIGWYKYRRNSQPIVTLRERYVHHNLIQELGFQPAKEFLFALFTSGLSGGVSTHQYNYQMLTASHLKSNFSSHKLRVVNLGDTSHSGYRQQPHTIRTSSSKFNDVINAYRDDFLDANGCLQQALKTHSMCISLMTKMKDLMNDVRDSEYTVLAMADDVARLRGDVEQRKQTMLQKLQTEQTSTLENHTQQPQASTSGLNLKQETEDKEPQKENLIDLNSDEEDNIRIVEGAELSKANLTQSPFRFMPKDTKPNSAPDVAVASAVRGNVRVFCTVSQYKSPSEEEENVKLSTERNGGLEVLKPQVIHDAEDEDETQDFSLSDDKVSKNATSSLGTILMDSMSQEY